MKIHSRISFVACFFLITVFSILKIYRNSLGYYNVGEGGIWNFIPIVFLIDAFLLVYVMSKKLSLFPRSIKYALASAILSQIHALFMWDSFSYYKVYSYFMITYYVCVLIVFYVVGKYADTKSNNLLCMCMIVAILIMAFISIYYFRTNRITFSMISNVYYALCILPFAFVLCKKPVVNWSISIFVGIVILLSGKRAGLIALFAFFVISAFVKALKKDYLEALVRMLFLVLAGGFSLVFLNDFVQSHFNIDILGRMTNLINDGGSGRVDLYRDIIEAVRTSDLQYIIFGHGMKSTGNITALTTAHDDFLEILYDYGIGPTVLFILFYLRLFCEGVQMYKTGYTYSCYFWGEIIISLILSLFSTYCVDFSYVTCGMAFLGFMLAQGQRYSDIQQTKGERI